MIWLLGSGKRMAVVNKDKMTVATYDSEPIRIPGTVWATVWVNYTVRYWFMS
jgi:hypothetical protein